MLMVPLLGQRDRRCLRIMGWRAFFERRAAAPTPLHA
jgi:hypothetical protein